MSFKSFFRSGSCHAAPSIIPAELLEVHFGLVRSRKRTHERRLRGSTRARLNGTGVMSAPRGSGSNPVFREARRPLVVLAIMVLLSMLQSQSVEIVGAILEVTARIFYFTLGL